jgi:DNA polymerase III delta prime subunit
MIPVSNITEAVKAELDKIPTIPKEEWSDKKQEAELERRRIQEQKRIDEMLKVFDAPKEKDELRHPEVIKMIKNLSSLKGKYLLHGPHGTGKKADARRIAKALINFQRSKNIRTVHPLLIKWSEIEYQVGRKWGDIDYFCNCRILLITDFVKPHACGFDVAKDGRNTFCQIFDGRQYTRFTVIVTEMTPEEIKKMDHGIVARLQEMTWIDYSGRNKFKKD